MTTQTERRPIRLVCLDMAGTTVSDGGLVEEAFRCALAGAGVLKDDPARLAMLSYVKATMGMSKIAVFRALFPDEELARRANEAFEATYEHLVAGGAARPIPGAVSTIEALRSAGIRVALLTGFSRTTRDVLVAALGWQEIADLLVCAEEAGRGRPYPDMVLHALLRLRVDDVAAVAVVGDCASDMVTGLRAGASVRAGVLTGADDRPRLVEAGATDVLASVAELARLLGVE